MFSIHNNGGSQNIASRQPNQKCKRPCAALGCMCKSSSSNSLRSGLNSMSRSGDSGGSGNEKNQTEEEEKKQIFEDQQKLEMAMEKEKEKEKEVEQQKQQPPALTFNLSDLLPGNASIQKNVVKKRNKVI